ncbi:MAG: peptidase C11 [Oscillospiraceae bacterium]|nr:peptidase C11 [Oscillospiraceae bacterium]
MESKRPRSREKHVTGPAKTVQKRGQGLGTGPVGDTGGREQAGSSGAARSAGTRSGGGMKLILLLLVLLLGGGGGLTALLGGQPDSQAPSASQPPSSGQQQSPGSLTSLLSGLGGGSVSSGWQSAANTGRLDSSVAPGAREKYTKLLGGGEDTATIMVYMCGTDLESRSGMGTADLQEMLDARFDGDITLLIYTGGCKAWKNSVVSSSANQIWQVKDGKLICLKENLGSVPMTDPDTLSGYIRWCAENYPASRYELILWDHGGGSVSGYGYDEKFASSGSMNLAGLDTALKSAGIKFDFIGFDACLMATAETALTMAQYADYLIASEETEPGVGWYYTDWLTAFGENTSLPTIQIGQHIADSFVDTCARKCPGQLTTLSVVDLAELETTLPGVLADFSKSTAKLIQNQQYQSVSNARSGAREFAQSSRIDQVDLVHLARNMGTKEGQALADILLGVVKYNRTSSNMTNAYGLSIYFPYRKVSMVDQAASAYRQIGMDEDYARCIRQFASVAASGQAASGGAASPLTSLLGGTQGGGSEMVSELLSAFLGGSFDSVAGLTSGNTGFLSDRAMSDEDLAQYLTDHHFPNEALVWEAGADGRPVLRLSEEQWGLVQSLELNLFYDDGEGYIDLGLDNVFSFDENGGLLGESDGSWLAVNGQPVAYYHTATVDDGTSYTITGRVPVLHNGSRAELILVFDSDRSLGFVAGIQSVYHDGETETAAKNQTALQPGDTLEFLCDYYSYAGSYQDSYLLGEPVTVTEDGLTISNVPLDGSIRATYRFTDLYSQYHWTPVVPLAVPAG